MRLFSTHSFRGLFALVLVAGLSTIVGCSSEEPAPQAAPDTSAAKRPASTLSFEGGATPSDQLPSGHPPVTEQAVPGAPAGSGTGEGGLTWSLPEGWISEPPSSSMRKAQYRVPGTAGDAELVVFYFGPGQGGDARSNAERWARQFSQPDGRSPLEALKTEESQVNGMKVMLVETSGKYENTMAPMAAASSGPQSDQMLLASIVEGPDANWFFKLTGPRATVEAQRSAFQQFTQSIRAGS